jgi:hypothetical protein
LNYITGSVNGIPHFEHSLGLIHLELLGASDKKKFWLPLPFGCFYNGVFSISTVSSVLVPSFVMTVVSVTTISFSFIVASLFFLVARNSY